MGSLFLSTRADLAIENLALRQQPANFQRTSGRPLVKRWLLGTHQGSVEDAHLPSYLNEFVFRFNRRHSRSRGMVFYWVLELAVGHDPVRYGDIIAGLRSRAVPRGIHKVRCLQQA
jgi:hypothetical protein